MEKLPNQTIAIEEVVKQAYEEEGLEKAAVETAIWRLTQQGQIYQPEPGKIRKL
jgi:DNA replicative helicase MCM subunit Mcm2 (Cdc46/Mcm family)